MVALNYTKHTRKQTQHGKHSQGGGYYNELEEVPDDILMELMARFGQTIMRARNDLEK